MYRNCGSIAVLYCTVLHGTGRVGRSHVKRHSPLPLPPHPPECVTNGNGQTGTLLSDPESSPINSLLPDLLRVSLLGAECFQDESQKKGNLFFFFVCVFSFCFVLLSMFASRCSTQLDKKEAKNTILV